MLCNSSNVRYIVGGYADYWELSAKSEIIWETDLWVFPALYVICIASIGMEGPIIVTPLSGLDPGCIKGETWAAVGLYSPISPLQCGKCFRFLLTWFPCCTLPYSLLSWGCFCQNDSSKREMNIVGFVGGESVIWTANTKSTDLGFGILLWEKLCPSFTVALCFLCCFLEPGNTIRLLMSVPISSSCLTPIIEVQLNQAFLVWWGWLAFWTSEFCVNKFY